MLAGANVQNERSRIGKLPVRLLTKIWCVEKKLQFELVLTRNNYPDARSFAGLFCF